MYILYLNAIIELVYNSREISRFFFSINATVVWRARKLSVVNTEQSPTPLMPYNTTQSMSPGQGNAVFHPLYIDRLHRLTDL